MAGLLQRPLREALNESNPNKIPAALQVARIGDALHGTLRYARGTCNASGVLELPADGKALTLSRARILSGTGTVGEKTITVPNTAPGGATNAAISAGGNVAFNGADATTVVEVWYNTSQGAVVTLDLAAVASVATFPGDDRGVLLISASVTDGVSNGDVGVLARGTAASSGNAALSNDGASVAFNAAQVVNGIVRVAYLRAPGEGAEPGTVSARSDADGSI